VGRVWHILGGEVGRRATGFISITGRGVVAGWGGAAKYGNEHKIFVDTIKCLTFAQDVMKGEVGEYSLCEQGEGSSISAWNEPLRGECK